MGDQVLITSRHLKVTDPQRKKIITPNIMLRTKDVMIPVVKTLKQNFNIPLSDNKRQILRARNYRNNPALLFSETLSHTLYNPLENLIEVNQDISTCCLKNVKRLNGGKLRNQSTKYTISGKTNSPNIEKRSILQDIFENSCPSKKLSPKKKCNALHFPNTELPSSKRDENDVKRLNGGNQSTKYTISGKTNSPSIEKRSILQNIFANSCPSKKLSHKKKCNTLHFPNTKLPSSKRDENLHEISSKSIKLSRKCNLSQIKKKNQIKYEDKFAGLLPICNIMNKSLVTSLESQSFHDFTDTVSTVSILSVSSFKLENKKTFANIENREKFIPRSASNHLQPNSEYEINVLHYENDNLLEKNIQDTLGILADKKSNKIIDHQCTTENPYKWDPCKIIRDKYSWEADNLLEKNIQDTLRIFADKKSNKIIDHQCTTENPDKWDVKSCKIIRDKYSWEADNLMPSSRRKNQNNNEIRNKIKYSWQVIGTSTQTSCSLLQDLLDDVDAEGNKSVYKMCNVKYSWQIIGIGAQASLDNFNDEDYWNGMLLTPNKNCNKNNTRIDNKKVDYAKLQNHSANYSENRLKRYLILNNQQTQTIAEKEVQVDTSDYCAKYSWHNLIKQYL